jgi:hypothetical protein
MCPPVSSTEVHPKQPRKLVNGRHFLQGALCTLQVGLARVLLHDRAVYPFMPGSVVRAALFSKSTLNSPHVTRFVVPLSQCLSDCTSRCCAAFHECADACCSSCARCFNSCCEGCFDVMAAACGAVSTFVSNLCQRPFSCCTFLGVAGNIFSLVAFIVLMIKQGEFVSCSKPYVVCVANECLAAPLF